MIQKAKEIFRPYYKYIEDFLIKKYFILSISSARKRGQSLKVVIGSSGKFQKGWIRSEKKFLNLLEEDDWNRYFRKNEINNLLAEHVWEHLTVEEGKKAASVCYKFLKINGRLRIAVPDGFHSSSNYIDQVKPGGFGVSADDHKLLYNYLILKSLLEEVGFKTYLLEYFDAQKNFNYNEWDLKDGMIRRSLCYDHRNKDGNPRYTSLIIDAIKES